MNAFLVFVLLVSLSAGFASQSGQSSPKGPHGRVADRFQLDFFSKSFIVNLHNFLRKNTNPPASDMMRMTWNDELAHLAKDWSTRCRFYHRPREGNVSSCGTAGYALVGESMTAAFLFNSLRADGDHEETQQRIRKKFFEAIVGIDYSWWAEYRDYDFEKNSCKPGAQCGHYTALVWAKSYEIGCGISECQGIEGYNENVKGIFLVCNYGPAGNFIGQKPYKTGNACESCPNECKNGLCLPPKDPPCEDAQPRACQTWASDKGIGCRLCDPIEKRPNSYYNFMYQQCPETCGFCKK